MPLTLTLEDTSQAKHDVPHTPEAVENFITATLDQHKARAILVLDVNQLCHWTDRMILCTATSTRHAKALAEELIKVAKAQQRPPLGVEGLNTCEWVLVDLADTVVHIMLQSQRELYQLEKLWAYPVKNSAMPQ